MNVDQLEYFIHQVYEGIFHDEAWHSLSNELGDNFFSSSLCLSNNVFRKGSNSLISTVDLSKDALSNLINTSVPEKNEGYIAFIKAEIAKPYTLESFTGPNVQNSIFNSFCRPQKIDKGLCVKVRMSNNATSFLSLFRKKNQKEYDKKDLLFIERLSKHIAHALEIRDLRISMEKRNIIDAQFNDLDPKAGLIVIDSKMRIAEASPISEKLLKEANGICRSADKIVSTSKYATRDTKSLYRYITHTSPGHSSFLIDGKEGYLLRLRTAPIAPDIFANNTAGFRALSIEILNSTPKINLIPIATFYDFTSAETKLLEALTITKSLTEASIKLGISRNTAKTHLANIFQKTSVNSQMQLMLLIGRFL